LDFAFEGAFRHAVPYFIPKAHTKSEDGECVGDRGLIECRSAMSDVGGSSSIQRLVRRAARQRLLFLAHAVRQMSRPDRMITVEEVRRAVLDGEIIEDYPEDVRGHSCLILGPGELERQIHVVCAPKADYLPSSLRIFHKWRSGARNSRPGGYCEVYPLPGTNGENLRSVPHRS
jgi:hypothetical protein